MKTEFKIEGLEEIKAKLKEVSVEAQSRATRQALQKASALVRDEAKAKALTIDDPKTAENISKNIVTRYDSKHFRNTKDFKYRVGVLGGAKDYSKYGEVLGKGKSNPGGDTFYWRFLEFGTKKAAAKPFLRGALHNNIDKATNKFIEEFNKGTDRALKRAKSAK